MFLGLSKNLGGGIRLHAGTRVGGRKRNGKTQLELKNEEKEGFLSKVSNVCSGAYFSFFENAGYDEKTIMYANFNEKHMEMYDSMCCNEHITTLFEEMVKKHAELFEMLEKTNFSGVLSAKTRENMTDLVFGIISILDSVKRNNELNNTFIARLANIENIPIEKMIKKIKKTKVKSNSSSIFKRILKWIGWFILAFIALAVLTAISDSS